MAGDYIQREPHEGKPGSQPTQLKILYDDKIRLRGHSRL